MDIALIGIGEIAIDQHYPAISASSDWSLAATVSRSGRIDNIPAYTNFEQMLEENPNIRVVSLCMPPVPRFSYAITALKAGRHAMLEKPPGATLAECYTLMTHAQERRLSLFATWHSREAEKVSSAKEWLSDCTIERLHVSWREDVRQWHAGQEWIWEPGGMGVFDPGINALSILTEILPVPIHLKSAHLQYPQNKQAPIAAALEFNHPTGAMITADFDWRQEGEQSWSIEAETDKGHMRLFNGGSMLEIDGKVSGLSGALVGEYPRLYRKMTELITAGESDVDLAPLRHAADAFMLGRRETVAEFID